jgi:hypothetical protein
LHNVMGYNAMVLHDTENCNKVIAPCECDHDALAYNTMRKAP